MITIEELTELVFGPQGDGTYWAEVDQKIVNVARMLDTTDGDKITDLLDRLYASNGSALGPEDCDIWPKSRNSSGYGSFSLNGTSIGVHRLAYEVHNGEIPVGMTIDHTCHNRDESCAGGKGDLHRACRNYAHLEPVTSAENKSRGRNFQRAKTDCPAGHSYARYGRSYQCGDGAVRRFCMACHTARRNRPLPTVVETITVRALGGAA